MSAFGKTAFVFGLCLIGMSVLSQPNKRIKVRMNAKDDFYYVIPESYDDKHLEDSIAKWFGRVKAKDILEKCNSRNWPGSAFSVLVEMDVEKINAYFSKLNCWKILTFNKTINILEVKPEDNKFLGDTSFHKSFYIFIDQTAPLAQVNWNASDPDVATTTSPNITSDLEMRKAFLASGKKKFLTAQGKLQEEVKSVTVTESEHLPLLTPFEENVKRILVLLCEGENNDIIISYTEDGTYKMRDVLPVSKVSQNGYTFLRFTFYNKSGKVYIENNRKSTLTYTYLFITEKNEADYRQYLAKQEEKERRELEQKAASAAADAEDYRNAKDRINRIRNKTDLFVRQGEWTHNFMVSYAEKDNWGWDEYLQYYNQLRSLYFEVVEVYNANIPKMSTNNMEYKKVKDWYTDVDVELKNMSELIKRNDGYIKNSKSPSFYTFKLAYLELIRMGKKIYDMEY